MSRLGLGDGVLAAAFPRLVRCSVSAYGRTGPFADLPGFDPVMQARSGMMLAQGGAGDPVASVAPVHDVGTAALATLGILAALFARARTGRGQHVTASLAGSSVFLQSGELTTFAGRPAAKAGGVDFPGPSAVRRYYRASDGWLAVAATTAAQVAGLLSAVGHPEWGALDDAARSGRAPERRAGERPVDDWVTELAARGVPACRVLPRAGELADPFLVANEFSHVVADPVVGKLRIVRGFSDWPGTRPASERPARGTTVGEETAAVLAAAGIGCCHPGRACRPDQAEWLARRISVDAPVRAGAVQPGGADVEGCAVRRGTILDRTSRWICAGRRIPASAGPCTAPPAGTAPACRRPGRTGNAVRLVGHRPCAAAARGSGSAISRRGSRA